MNTPIPTPPPVVPQPPASQAPSVGTKTDMASGAGAPVVVNMQEVMLPTRLRMLIYGEPGVGKTTLAGQAPKPLIFDFDDGATALRGQNVDVVKSPTWPSFQRNLQWLLQGGGRGYETIIIDTLTIAQRATMLSIIGPSEDPKMGFDGWGKLLHWWRQSMQGLKQLPCHIIYICHARSFLEGDDNSGRRVLAPELSGKLLQEVQAEVDTIALMEARGVRPAPGQPYQVERTLSFASPDGSFVAKDRGGLFGTRQHANIGILQQIVEGGVPVQSLPDGGVPVESMPETRPVAAPAAPALPAQPAAPAQPTTQPAAPEAPVVPPTPSAPAIPEAQPAGPPVVQQTLPVGSVRELRLDPGPTGWEGQTIDVLGLSVRPSNVLKKHGIRTVADVLCHSAATLKGMQGMGKTSLDEIEVKLALHQLYLPSHSTAPAAQQIPVPPNMPPPPAPVAPVAPPVAPAPPVAGAAVPPAMPTAPPLPDVPATPVVSPEPESPLIETPAEDEPPMEEHPPMPEPPPEPSDNDNDNDDDDDNAVIPWGSEVE